MEIIGIVFCCLAALNTAYLSYMVIDELIRSIKKRKQRGKLDFLDDLELDEEDNDSYSEFEVADIELAPSLRSSDVILKLTERNVADFISGELLPISHSEIRELSISAVESASILLSALIKFLIAEAPEMEKNLDTLLELLEACEPTESLEEKDCVELTLENSARYHRSKAGYYGEYLIYKMTCPYKEQVIQTCIQQVKRAIDFCDNFKQYDKEKENNHDTE